MEPWQTDPNDPRVKALITELAQNQPMREWREKMQAGIAAVARAKADTLRKAQYFRCLGLASGDPEHLEFYAHEVNLEPAFVQEILNRDDGARLGLVGEGQLRSSGELDQIRLSWVMPDVLKVIKTGIASESVLVAIKLVETIGKQTARGGENREVTAALPRFEGSADDLIAWLTDFAPSRGSLPFKKPRDG
jgi:hypothetical protein